MSLTQDQIIEIQTAAKLSYERQVREMEERNNLKKEVAKAQAEAKERAEKQVSEAKESPKKGK